MHEPVHNSSNRNPALEFKIGFHKFQERHGKTLITTLYI